MKKQLPKILEKTFNERRLTPKQKEEFKAKLNKMAQERTAKIKAEKEKQIALEKAAMKQLQLQRQEKADKAKAVAVELNKKKK